MPNDVANRLLAALPERDWARLQDRFRIVDLTLGKVLFEANQRIEQLLFPLKGVISTVATFENGAEVEMATTGNEGMVSVAAALSSDTAINRSLVQVPGCALAIDYAEFRRAEKEFPSFRETLLIYTQAFLAQTLQTVACNAVHSVEERASRWLLMTHDRAGQDTFVLTQEFLAEMLGVSRPAVSMVARSLQKDGLIQYNRGVVRIVDRPALEASSCECYSIIRAQYERRLFRILNANGHGPIGAAGKGQTAEA
ncbi:Crp/Fnr family transcriptional regulator [Alsobacter sp. SYSU M60028]|uniref:Crp/Fnr family transcriptional regulator n=1 Tax=Alsobacter ponti TaxID=2962936 RepID=A0ABT1L7R2_9HYPH|nr:Crp/Fnr family transcriptional regulator [Alsobacter ponti]MCP8937531.1 Crp/Fnr family transcriptional regulator [Alsobacter ponti]